ncbi:hypothetical protein N656DRAFT_149432 [Canariomyces notabilis]|uniref:Uncharacterized protein n=1 Tax=Canariomyces notabilis TaxID=2074819 RepID=A0AAN6TCB9_9PEZI|nr:hypothetical protein N656DRAFT_149432 [Canariomyces arenarius]
MPPVPVSCSPHDTLPHSAGTCSHFQDATPVERPALYLRWCVQHGDLARSRHSTAPFPKREDQEIQMGIHRCCYLLVLRYCCCLFPIFCSRLTALPLPPKLSSTMPATRATPALLAHTATYTSVVHYPSSPPLVRGPGVTSVGATFDSKACCSRPPLKQTPSRNPASH